MSISSIDSQFAQFVAFAQKEIDAGKKTAVARGVREITVALNADSGHLHGHGYLRLGNEVMLEASDL